MYISLRQSGIPKTLQIRRFPSEWTLQPGLCIQLRTRFFGFPIEDQRIVLPSLVSMPQSSYNEAMRRSMLLLAGLFLIFSARLVRADNSAFDLAGPKVDVRVKRGEITLPIAETPYLLPGDRLWVHADLPETQTNHFVLVVAFLRGATNLPPSDWFTRVETWTKDVRAEGVFVTIPAGAEQALMFLAPETGGDFSTLRKAVHDRPGVFVRAAQDLAIASWERMRLETYLDDVRQTNQTDAKDLKQNTELSARSLGIRVDQSCFERPAELQATCLTQHTEGLLMDDANAQSLVNQLANGTAGDLMNQLSYSPMGGAGLYSPYIGAIVDTAKILASLHTAHFQYIPALALPEKDTMNLRLNVAPSFRDPKSVVVVALPPIGESKAPPLRAVNAGTAQCAQAPGLALAVEGAPLIFGTNLAHDLKLHIESAQSYNDIPVRAESTRGGLIATGPLPALPQGAFTAVLRGKWGFDDWEGPRFHLVSAVPDKWSVASADQSALVVGREDKLHIQGESAQCVFRIDLRQNSSSARTVPFKAAGSDQLELSVPLENATPGVVTLEIHQHGSGKTEKPDTVLLSSYAEAASLDRLTLSVGDRVATLKGTRLDEVAKASFNDIAWSPAGLTRVEDFDQLTLQTNGPTDRLTAAGKYTAKVQLEDGRELKVPVTVRPPRPQVSLLNKGTQQESGAPVRLGSADDLPLDSKLVFFLKSEVPQSFPRNENVEVAADDGSFRTVLSIADGTLMLEDARTALGTVEPLARFGPSAFGPLRARAISSDGVPGEWMNLGTLVRIPAFKELRCPRSTAKPCTLTGNNLFLAQTIGSTQDLSSGVEIPPDFTGAQLSVPHPVNGQLYLKLRDDPSTVQTLSMPVTPATLAQPPAAGQPATPAQASAPASSQQPSQSTAQPPVQPPAVETPAPSAAQPAPQTLR